MQQSLRANFAAGMGICPEFKYRTGAVRKSQLGIVRKRITADRIGLAPAGRGRPRDPAIEARVFDAAMALYAEVGWTGFTFEAVARSSGVGKASLYRRWPQRGDLLRRTFEARWLRVGCVNQGDIRADLHTLAWIVARSLTGPYAGAHDRLPLDIAEHPEVLDFLRPYAEATIAEGRAIVRRAVDRRQLPNATNPGLVMDLIVGAIANHVRMTPARLRSPMLQQLDTFVLDLVEIVLTGLVASSARVSFQGGGPQA